MQLVSIRTKEYPVNYDISAMLWFADYLSVSTEEVYDIMLNQMTERKGMALMYSGLVSGAEEKERRLDISFKEFQEILIYEDEGLSEILGALFQKQFEVTVSKLQAKLDKQSSGKKQNGIASTSKRSTSASLPSAESVPEKQNASQ